MRQVESEVDRYLVLLGNAIRRQGFTQLEVQQELHWGRSYISQLVTKQKSLRVEQVLLILKVIGVDPEEFFAELYAVPGGLHAAPRAAPPPQPRPGQAEEELRELRGLIHGLVELLVERRVIDAEELGVAVEVADQEE